MFKGKRMLKKKYNLTYEYTTLLQVQEFVVCLFIHDFKTFSYLIDMFPGTGYYMNTVLFELSDKGQ